MPTSVNLVRTGPPNLWRRRWLVVALAAVLAVLGLEGASAAAQSPPGNGGGPQGPGPLEALLADDAAAWGVVSAGPERGAVVRIDPASGAVGAIQPAGPRPGDDAPVSALLLPDGRYVTAHGRAIEVFAAAGPDAVVPVTRPGRVDLPQEVGCGPTDPLVDITRTPDGALAAVTGRGGVAVVPSDGLADGTVVTGDAGLDCAGSERATGIAATEAGVVVATDTRVVLLAPAADGYVAAAEAARSAPGPSGVTPVSRPGGLVALASLDGLEVWRTSGGPGATLETTCVAELGGAPGTLGPLGTDRLLVGPAGSGTVHVVSPDCSVAWSRGLDEPSAPPAASADRVALTQSLFGAVRAVVLEADSGEPILVSEGAIPGCDTAADCAAALAFAGDLLVAAGPAGSTTLTLRSPDEPADGDAPDSEGGAGGDPGAPPGDGGDGPAGPGGDGEAGDSSAGGGDGTPDGGDQTAAPAPNPLPSFPSPNPLPSFPASPAPPVVSAAPPASAPSSPVFRPPTSGRAPRTLDDPTPLNLSDLLADRVASGFLSDFLPGATTGAAGSSPGGQGAAQGTLPGLEPVVPGGTIGDADDPFGAAFDGPEGSSPSATGSPSGDLDVEELALGVDTGEGGSDALALVVLLVVGMAAVLVMVVASRTADSRKAAAGR